MRHRRLPTLALVAALVAAPGCVGGPATPAGVKGEGRISADAWGNVQIAVGGRSFRVKAADLKPIGDVSVQAGGRFYTLREGRFAMPEGALRDVKENSRSFFRVFVPGYVPKPVWIGQADEEILLSPIRPIAVAMAMPPTGGKVAASDGSVGVTVPPGMLTKPDTRVALSGYRPEVTAEDTKQLEADRADFLAKVKSKAARAFALAQAAACEAPNEPLPCPPAVEAMGVMLTVDGPLQPGTMTVSVDLAKLLRGWDGTGTAPWRANPGQWTPEQIGQATAADVIMRTHARIQAHADAAAYKEILASDYGVRIDGTMLHFLVRVGIDDTVDGFVRTDVEGVSLLGAKLEFTGVSSTNQALPPAALPPALLGPSASAGAAPAPGAGLLHALTDASPLIGMDGASLIGMDAASLIGLDGASLIGQDGATLIGNDGGSLIGNDGGSLIGMDAASLIGLDGGSLIGADGASLIGNDGGSLVGGVQVPFTASQAKYALRAYTESVWDGGSVRILDWDGRYLTDSVPIQAAGWYAMRDLPPTKPFFLLEAAVGPYKLYAVAIAPGKKLTSVRIDAATTVVATAIWDAVRRGALDPAKIYLPKYNQMVADAKHLLTQQQAQDAVTPPATPVAPGAPLAAQPNPAAVAAASSLGLLGAVLDLVLNGLVPALVGPPPPAPSTAIDYTTAALVDVGSGVPSPTNILGVGTTVYAAAGAELWSIDATDGSSTKLVQSSDKADPTFSLPWYRGMFVWGPKIYIADARNRAIVRYNTASRKLELHAYVQKAGVGYDPGDIDLGPTNDIWFTSPGFDAVGSLPNSGGDATFVAPGTWSGPQGIAVHPDRKRIFVADTGHHTIKVVELANPGTATIVAGAEGVAGNALGAGADARFNQPHDVAFDGSGNLLVADAGNNQVKLLKEVAPGTWQVEANVAGTGASGSGTARPASSGQLAGPQGVGFDANGHMYVADERNGKIRIVRP